MAVAPPIFSHRISRHEDCTISFTMPRKYSRKAQSTVEQAMQKRKRGKLKSGKSGTTVKSKKQAIAIGLSEARKKGAKVPKKKASKKKK
jgi:hypothetical protein